MHRVVAILCAASAALVAQAPEYTKDGAMVLPKDYREWIFLSSGLGMTYGPLGDANRDRPPTFDNVFVNPAAYKSFLEHGTWPDKTILILEVRSSLSKGSINTGGHYQNDIVGIEAHVKDSRFPGKWAFFGFRPSATTGSEIRGSACQSCHSRTGAVDDTFVQFYPTLLEVARAKGTLTPAYLSSEKRQ